MMNSEQKKELKKLARRIQTLLGATNKLENQLEIEFSAKKNNKNIELNNELSAACDRVDEIVAAIQKETNETRKNIICQLNLSDKVASAEMIMIEEG